MTTPVDKENKGRFVQFPHNLIYGYPELTRDDKWTLLAIMGLCWTDGPHRLSYRDISNMSGVPISLLSSIEGKNGKKSKEGIINRLERLGLIRVTKGKEVDAVTGKIKGNAATYVYIEYKDIWQENVTYCENKKASQVEPFKVSQDCFKPVSYTNKVVSIENNLDINVNKPVSDTNESVSDTNEPVHFASTKHTPNIGNTLQISKDIEDKRDTAHADTQSSDTVVSSSDENNALSSLSEISLMIENNPLLSDEQKRVMLAALNTTETTHIDEASYSLDSATPTQPTSSNVLNQGQGKSDVLSAYHEAISKDVSENVNVSQDMPEVTSKEVAVTDARQGKGTGRTRGRHKKTEQPELLPEDIDRIREQKEQEKRDEERRKNIRLRIEARRGYAFKEKKFLNECIYVKKLSEEWDDAQIEAINKYMFERHWKYSKPDNKFKFGAYEMYEEAPSIAQILREERIAKEQGRPPTNISEYRRSSTSQHSNDPRIAATVGSQPTVTAINEACEEALANWDEEAFLASLEAEQAQKVAL